VTKDIAYDLDVGPGIDLPGRMTVSKSMCADYFGRNASQMCIVLDTVANGAAGHTLIRHFFPEEEVPV
jgi:hypothetical protein